MDEVDRVSDKERPSPRRLKRRPPSRMNCRWHFEDSAACAGSKAIGWFHRGPLMNWAETGEHAEQFQSNTASDPSNLVGASLESADLRRELP
ncbi:MAG TPA: hypothetical protein DCE44_06015 [Verrucomicrobiales bacterium]|nr:hypothetical protein [Verrucomicrobiales bacterium]